MDGVDGTDGIDGVDGTDGVDGISPSDEKLAQMIAAGILVYMEQNPPADLGPIHDRLDQLEDRIDNIGINFTTRDVDNSVVTPPQWVKRKSILRPNHG